MAFTDPTESLGVRRAIELRVDALGDVERHLLTVASLIGRDVPDALLDAVVGESADAALAAIERSGLMRRNQGQHTFVHDLVRETMRDRLPPNERRGLYAAIVDVADRAGLRACLMPAQLAWLATQAVPAIAAGASRGAAGGGRDRRRRPRQSRGGRTTPRTGGRADPGS